MRDGRVYAATADTGRFLAFDARSGRLELDLDFRHWPMFSSPALAGRRAYIGSHLGQLLAIDLDAGRPAWAFPTEGAVRAGDRFRKADGTPDGAKAFGDGFYDSIVVGLHALLSNGAVLSSPAVAQGAVVFGSMDGSVYAVE